MTFTMQSVAVAGLDIVELRHGDKRVTVTTVEGSNRAHWVSSAGDRWTVGLDAARDLVRDLMAKGWKLV